MWQRQYPASPLHCCSAVSDIVPPPLEEEGGGGVLAYSFSRVTGRVPPTSDVTDVCVPVPISMTWVPRAPHGVPGRVSLGIGGYSLPSSSPFVFLPDPLPYSVFWVPTEPHGVPGPVSLVVG